MSFSLLTFLVFAQFVCSVVASSTEVSLLATDCPLWHVKQNGHCVCSSGFEEIVKCRGTFLNVRSYFCITWDKETDSVRASYCLHTPMNSHVDCKARYEISVNGNLSGTQLNSYFCGGLNREGTQCKHCKSGYGPAPFSDGITCADCSRDRHLWILTLLLQLLCLTLLSIIVITLKIKAASCPLNFIITYSQLVVNAIKFDTYILDRMICVFGKRGAKAILSLLGLSNLDFFNVIIPPFCISSSVKRVDTFLLDYIIALFPLMMTVCVYLLIELHDRNYRIVVILGYPLRRLNRCFPNCKQSIINAFVTFLLLSYSKLLFVSCKFLIAVQSYDIKGELIPNSTVLLHDPNIVFFKSNHIPYIITAFSILVIFVFMPPLLLLLYPTRLFRKVVDCCGFRRWDILHMIMDAFQGWYKDGTEGTRDYRQLSALYMLLRIGIVGEYLTVIHLLVQSRGVFKWYVTGAAHILLGTFHFIFKPYKKRWMNVVDGLLLIIVGSCVLTYNTIL